MCVPRSTPRAVITTFKFSSLILYLFKRVLSKIKARNSSIIHCSHSFEVCVVIVTKFRTTGRCVICTAIDELTCSLVLEHRVQGSYLYFAPRMES